MNEKKINNFLEFKDYYTRNPDHFIEEFLGVKLLPYQRMILKATDKLQTVRSVRSGKRLEHYLRALEELASLNEDSRITFYGNKKYKEITRDEAIEYVLKKLNYK